MLRKVSHIILIVILLISTSGFAVSNHYCGGELISSSIIVEAETCCDSDSCCKTELQIFQLKVDYYTSSGLELPKLSQVNLFNILLEVLDENREKGLQPNVFTIADPPPPEELHMVLAKWQTYLL